MGVWFKPMENQPLAGFVTLKGDKGARDVMQAHDNQILEIEAGDDAPLADIDTVEALAAYRN